MRISHFAIRISHFFFLLLCLSSFAGSKAGRVQIGYCSQLKEIDAAKAAGFDYIEVRTSEIAALTDGEYEKLAQKLKELGIPAPAAYQFVPGNIKLTGPKVDKAEQMAYVRKALDRVARLGVRTITFGSGQAREVPEGFSRADAFQQLIDFGKRIGPEAKARNITIAIEPQRRQECNIINSTAEALELVNAIDHPNFQLMIDFYHFSVEKEDPAIILKAKDHIRHVHMANPEGRVFPLKWDEYNYAPFFQNLRKIGYDRLVGLEARATDFSKEAPQAIALLHRAFEQ